MIFPTRKKISKGKSVTAVCDFSATQSKVGKIVMDSASNVNVTNGLTYAGAFVPKDFGVMQYLGEVNGDAITLQSKGLYVGNVQFSQFAGLQKVEWTFDKNNSALMVVASSSTYKIVSGQIEKIADVAFDDLALCQSRLFGLAGNRLYVSAPTENTFQSDVWVDLPTNCVALVNNGHLYAIGNDVYKINLDGDEANVKITKMCANIGVVQKDTVCAYGNKILLVANGQINCLQQGAPKVLAQLQNTPVFATMHNGLYYLSLANGTICAYNPQDGQLTKIHHVSSKYLYSNGTNLFSCDGVSGVVLTDESNYCYWKSLPINFDNQGTIKHLHRLLIQTETDVIVTIQADCSRTLRIKGKDALQSFLLTGFGKQIYLHVSSTEQMSVGHLSLTVRPSEVSV